jgi:hypothetical protein
MRASWSETPRRLLQVAWFFTVVPVVPRGMLAAFGVAALVGGLALAADPTQGVRTVAPVLLLQLFAGASGFVVPARRGHYDLLLTRGDSRLAIAVVHWMMSIAPGIVTWLTLAAIVQVAGGQSLVAPGTLLSLLVVSTLSWSLTVPLPRLTGAIVWLLAFALVSVALPASNAPAAPMLLPWALLGSSPQPLFVAIIICCLVLTMAATIGWVSRMDVPLESGQ